MISKRERGKKSIMNNKRDYRVEFTHKLPDRALDYLESLELLGETRGVYTTNRRHLYLFTNYLGDTPLASVKYKEAKGFVLFLTENYPEYSAGYIANILKSVRRFYKREKELGYVFEDPFLYVKSPRVSKILPRNVPKDRDIKRLMSVIPRGNYRDRLIIELLYGSGIRAGELLKLKVSDVNYTESTIRVIDSKSKKERITPINDITIYSIREYLEKERPLLFNSEPPRKDSKDKRKIIKEQLLVKRGGYPLCSWRLSLIIDRYAKEAGLEFRLTPHSFRHACATEMLKGGASIRHIQTMLGHDTISTTMIYTKLGVDELKTVLDNFHLHGARR